MVIETEENASSRRHAAGPADGRRHHVGRVSHGGAVSGRCAWTAMTRRWSWRPVRQGHQPRQRPRHRYADRRHRGGQRHPGRRRAARRGLRAEVGTGPLHRSGRCAGVDPDGPRCATGHPPTLNYETPDPEIDLDVVAGEPRYGDYQYAINNSFGFGGHNVALAFGRY